MSCHASDSLRGDRGPLKLCYRSYFRSTFNSHHYVLQVSIRPIAIFLQSLLSCFVVWFIHIVAHINLVHVNLVVQLVGSLLAHSYGHHGC